MPAGSSACRPSRAAHAAGACLPLKPGDLQGALAAGEEALRWHAQVELPRSIGAARSSALGAVQRRLKRRREARETLEEALGVFERIGGALGPKRVRAEVEAHQRARGQSRRIDAGRGARRRPRCGGQDEQGGRGSAVSLSEQDCRGPPRAHLREARSRHRTERAQRWRAFKRR
jgi:hypothetical protein